MGEDGRAVILCIQILIFAFSSSESLLCTFHQGMVWSPGLSNRSYLAHYLSVRMAGGSSLAVHAQSIHTVLRKSHAQGFCWEMMPAR